MQLGDGGDGDGRDGGEAPASRVSDSDGSESLLLSRGGASLTTGPGDRGGSSGGGAPAPELTPAQVPTPPDNRVSTSSRPENTAGYVEGNQIQHIDENSLIIGNSRNLANPDDGGIQLQQAPLNPQPDDPAGALHENRIQQNEPNNQMIIEEDIIRFVNQNLWEDLENRLVQIIDIPESWKLHPVLFFHVRRSKMLHLLDTKRLDDAAAFFDSHIKGLFNEVKEASGQQKRLTFASVVYLQAQVNFCAACITTNARAEHTHGDLAIIRHAICDYFRLNIPSKIRYVVPPSTHGMWRLGIRHDTPPGNSKPSFRCMACQHVFNKESIGKLERHLNGCIMMDTTHLQQLFASCRSRTSEGQSGARVTPGGRSHTSVQTTSRMPELSLADTSSLSASECTRLFKKNLSAARVIEGKIDEDWSKLLGTALDNIEVYVNMIISRSGPEVQAAPSAPQGDLQSRLAVPLSAASGSAVRAAPSTQLVVTASQLGQPVQARANNVNGIDASDPDFQAPLDTEGTHSIQHDGASTDQQVT